MRLIPSLTLFAAMICAAGTAPAQEAPLFSEQDKVAIEKLYDRYLQAFVTQDYAALRECIHAPFVVFARGDIRTLETADAVVAFYRSQRQTLEQRNYLRAEVLKTRITPLTPASALVNKFYRRYKKDGSFMEDGAAIYPVSKSPGGWKLRGVVPQDTGNFGKDY